MNRIRTFFQSRNAIVFIATGLVFTLAAGLFAFKSRAADSAGGTPAGAQSKPALTVSTVPAQASQWPVRLVANGNVAAWQEASLGSQANGLRLSEVRVNVGDVVQRGQVLARFAADSVQADVAQARAALAEAQASAADAQANAERARSIQASGALSRQQIAQYGTAELTAQARVEVARATLNAQTIRLQHTEVRAPDSGTISARSASVGAVLPAGTELFRLIRQGRLEWRAELPSDQLGRIQSGLRVVVAGASSSAPSAQGTVRSLAPTVDAQSRNGIVYVDLPKAAAAAAGLKAGMFAQGSFVLGSAPAVTVPNQAVVVRDGFAFVFTLGPDQHVQQQAVQTGRHQGDQVEITRGLRAGDAVVAAGAGFLSDGDRVRVVPAAISAKP